jgi:hypothetical protein
MGIDINNYEQYFLDHLEGNLSPEQERELSVFLKAHPELKQLLEDFDAGPVPAAEPIIFHKKNNLRKTIHPTAHIHENNAEEWMVSSLEGLLNEAEEKELSVFLAANPVFDRGMESLRKTVLKADTSIIFPDKNRLKKKAPVLALSRAAWVSALAAAVLLLFFGLRYFLYKEEPAIPVQSKEVAKVQEQKIPQPLEKPAVSGEKLQTALASPLQTPENKTIAKEIAARESSFTMAQYDASFVKNRKRTRSFRPEYRETVVLIQESPEKKSLLGRVAGNLLADAGTNLKENTRIDKISKPHLNFWSVISGGIKGYNTITDRNIELLVQKDREGKISSYALVEQSEVIFTRDLNKN